MFSLRKHLTLVLAASFIAATPSDAAFPPVSLKPVCLQQIHSPTTITSAPGGSGRLFICDQPGKIYIFQNGMLLPAPFLDLTGKAVFITPPSTAIDYSERGLLGLAFHPGYANPLSSGYRKFYVNYTRGYVAGVDPAPPQIGDPINGVTVIAEFEASVADPNQAAIASERSLLVFTQPQSNHNGGQLEFGPDGLLYIGTGDGGSSNDNNAGHTGGAASPRPTNNLGNSLDKTRYLGKILRIDPIDPDGAGPLNYSVPATNPFFNDPTPGLKKEIYAYGLRNPWKFSFDQRAGGTNRLFCGDVGQGRIEEINLIVAGGNYGWRYKEGLEFPAFSSGATTNPMADPLLGPYIDPIATYAHPGVVTSPVLPQLGLSVTGGFVYRGAAIPGLQGKYVFGDYGVIGTGIDGRLMGLEETAPGSGVFTLTQAIPLVGSANPIPNQRLLCLGEDANGEIYLGLKSNTGVMALAGGLPAGGIYKLVPPASVALPAMIAAKDNTIFSDGEPVTANGNSNGGGSFLFAGYASPNDYQARRALLAFDLSPVPAGVAITSAAVHIFCDKRANVSPQPGPFNLHRLTADWGEGYSNSDAMPGAGDPASPGDATWRLRLVTAAGNPPTGTAWAVPGGDFAAAPSATTTIAAAYVNYIWSSNQNLQLAADVNAWLAAPAANLGWMLIGPEGPTVGATAKRFISRENQLNPDAAPKLFLSYGIVPPPTRFETWLATYFPTNPVGKFIDPTGDLDGDGIANQIEYSFGFSPFVANLATGGNPLGAGLETTAVTSGGNVTTTITFRRDPRATDLTYLLQTSPDLAIWTTVTQSSGGGVPTGAAFFAESNDPNDAPIKRVVSKVVLSVPAQIFTRLVVIRAP